MRTSIKSSLLVLVIFLSGCDAPGLWVDLIYLSVDVVNILQYERDQRELARQPPLMYKGKCIEPCYLSVDYLDSGFEIPVYTGNDPDMPWMKRETILIHPEYNRWVCRSEEEECRDWIRVTIPARDTTLLLVTDTTRNKDYDLIFVHIAKGEQQERTDWREVLCPDALSPELVRDMFDFLKAEGYANFRRKKYFSNALHEALIRYQRDNALPVGHIDAETLYAMGLDGYWHSTEELW